MKIEKSHIFKGFLLSFEQSQSVLNKLGKWKYPLVFPITCELFLTQFVSVNMALLLNKPFVNGVILREQSLS